MASHRTPWGLPFIWQGTLLGLALLICQPYLAVAGDATFTVATYNLENYLLEKVDNRPAKTAAARAKVCEIIKSMAPDVLALQEVAGQNALAELRSTLKSEGLDYPEWEWIQGPDPLLNLAILSKYPIVARRPHRNLPYLMNGRRFEVQRGFAEVDIRISGSYTFTLITAHLKSKRPVPQADDQDLREMEVRALRDIINKHLEAKPGINLVVAGDFNDTKSSPAIKTVLGRGNTRLEDTRPAERNGDLSVSTTRNHIPRNICWTYYYAKEETYSRIDYILLSPGMQKEWDDSGTYVVAAPDWGIASDHRPILARFYAADR